MEKSTGSWDEEILPSLRSCPNFRDANVLRKDGMLSTPSQGLACHRAVAQPLESHFALPHLPILPIPHRHARKG